MNNLIISKLDYCGSIGCRQGSQTSMKTPNGTVIIKIEEVIYQPEAVGDLAL